VDAVSIEGVRVRCGASVGSIYHHFGNRYGIVAALYFEIFDAQSQRIQTALDNAHDAESGVKALVTGYLDWVVDEPQHARFLFQARGAVAAGPRTPELTEAAQRRNRALVNWFEPHRAAGAVRALPCELMPSLVMGPVQSYCRAWLSALENQGHLASPTQYRHELAAAAWRSVQADQGAKARMHAPGPTSEGTEPQ
jgi:AcrR family transcriptional regulator